MSLILVAGRWHQYSLTCIKGTSVKPPNQISLVLHSRWRLLLFINICISAIFANNKSCRYNVKRWHWDWPMGQSLDYLCVELENFNIIIVYIFIPPLVERGLYCNHLVRPFVHPFTLSFKMSQLLLEEIILFFTVWLRIFHVCRNENFRNSYLSFYWNKWFYIWYMALAWWLVPCLPFPGLPHIYFLFTVRLRIFHICRNENFCNRYLSFYWKKWFYIWYMALAWWLVPCLPFPGLLHIYFLFTERLRIFHVCRNENFRNRYLSFY